MNKVEPELVNQFIRLSKQRLTSIQESDSTEHILTNLGLLDGDRLNRAGMLLFTREPDKLFHTVRLRIGRLKGADILDSREFTGSLFRQLDLAMDRLKSLLQVRYDITVKKLDLEGLQRKEVWEYPLEALREAVLNALIHRDYSISSDIQIRLYQDELSIWNPGGLLEGIHIEDLYQREHKSLLRNPLIAQVFYYAGLIEKWGSGTYRILNLCKEQKLPAPVFDADENSFKIHFNKDIYTIENLIRLVLNERQRQAIRYIKQQGTITNTEYQRLTNTSKSTATRDLDELIQKGLIIKKGKTGRGTKYMLKGS